MSNDISVFPTDNFVFNMSKSRVHKNSETTHAITHRVLWLIEIKITQLDCDYDFVLISLVKAEFYQEKFLYR